jgi:PAS domain S-box-containing protein
MEETGGNKLPKQGYMAIVIAAILLIALVIMLLTANGISRSKLKTGIESKWLDWVKTQAAATSYFHTERLDDLKTITEGSEIRNYFRNKALGMSRQYGLQASIATIREKFRDLLEHKRIGGEAVYSCIEFVQTDGERLVVTSLQNEEKTNPYKNTFDNSHHFSGKEENGKVTFDLEESGDGPQIVGRAPFYFAGKLAGYVNAYIRWEIMARNFLEKETHPETFFFFYHYNHAISSELRHITVFPAALESFQKIRAGQVAVFQVNYPDETSQELLGTRFPITGTSLCLLAITPTASLFGKISPQMFIWGMGFLALCILGGSAVIVRHNIRYQLLLLHMHQQDVQGKRTVEKKNEQLEKARRALSRQAENHRILLDNIHIQIWYLTCANTYGAVNQAHADFFGMKKANLEGKDVADMYLQSNREFFNIRETIHLEEWVKNAKGKRRLLAIVMTPKLTKNGQVEFVVCCAEDITDRRKAENRLREQKALLGNIIANVPASIFWKDRQSVFQGCNALFARRVGLAHPDDIIGKTNYAFSREQHEADFYREYDKKVIETGKPLLNIEIPVEMDGKALTLLSSKVPMRNEGGQIVGLIGISTDITDIKNLLKQQSISIELAKNILKLINGTPLRHIDLANGLDLFFEAISIPCHAEGGDHYFMQHLPKESAQKGYGKTVISLKDQSGHEVGCILKSIITDLIHHSILFHNCSRPLESRLMMLNEAVCQSGIFQEDDFFTTITFEIDHETCTMKYVSAGHPPFILIRGKEVSSLPEKDKPGANIPMGSLPVATFSAAEIQLQEGDRLLFYTDGLTEMPLKNLNKIITTDTLKQYISSLLQQNSKMAISDIMQKVLSWISACSRETVDNAPLKNTSSDDVTLLCLEIENQDHDHIMVLNPVDINEISEHIEKLYSKMGRQWQQYGFESPALRIRMVLEEALLNAWKHGNQQNPDKAITVRWRFGNDFHLTVIDEGEGFDYQNLPDPVSDENRIRECGRGIFIIRHFADVVCWKDDGRQLVCAGHGTCS